MYNIKLDLELLKSNAKIIGAIPHIPQTEFGKALNGDISTFHNFPMSLSGIIHNGHNEVTASIVPGASGTVDLSFEIKVPSITPLSFDFYRFFLKKYLMNTEENIAQAAGIICPPPPEAASKMANYALQLFSELVFDGELISNQSRTFNVPSGSSSKYLNVLKATRLLSVMVTKASFSGNLSLRPSSAAHSRKVSAYVPTTVIEFEDGLKIPFAGYSDNVSVDYNGLKSIAIPKELWS